MHQGRDIDGQRVIRDLIKKCVVANAYESESALARAMNVFPQKLNRWKNGKSRPSSEAVSMALILLSCPTAEGAKFVLDRKYVTVGRYLAHQSPESQPKP